MCPFDNTAFAISGKVGISLLQLTVLSRSAIVVQSKYVVVFFVFSHCFLDFSVDVETFIVGLSLSQISSFSHCHNI